ncbi:MAG: SMI1/KNR4 family protein [Saccharofermentans sp.]|nr:SMI1/KNR4 family protein [Saccharofermentans sp.]
MGLVEVLSRKEDVYHKDGVSDEAIHNAEAELSLQFAEDYRDYLKRFSLLSYDYHELTGLCDSPRLNVVMSTKREKQENELISPDMYLLEQIGVENLTIWQNTRGEVFEVPYKSNPIKICDSLIEYIERQ